MKEQIEEWREIKKFPNYEVSSFGRVRSKPGGGRGKGRILKQSLVQCNVNSYLKVWLYNDKKKNAAAWVHRLVCMAFHGERPFGMNMVRHADDNGQNNHKDNLAWGTRAHNERDKDGGTPCECGCTYADHDPETGYCHGMKLGAHCECQGFKMSRGKHGETEKGWGGPQTDPPVPADQQGGAVEGQE